jgi:hypothetical protein
MGFDPDTITQQKLHDLRRAAERAWSNETRPEDSRGHPQPSAGHCYVTSHWLQSKLGGGYIGQKEGHFFWVSPDKNYVIDLTGDQDASIPVKGEPRPQDTEDEPYQYEPELLRHRPGPIIYTHATNPLYRDFRIVNPLNSESGNLATAQRAQLFAERANAALEGKLLKQADSGGSGSDAYPGEGPQAEEEFNQRDFHDPVVDDLNLSMEEPIEHEYQFVYANGQLQVSPTHTHEDLLHQVGILPDHNGPIAVGYINLRGRDALWSVETNIGLRGLVKELKRFTKEQKWTWGGLVDSTGNPIHDDFGAKKSYWYGWRDSELKLSAQPFWGSAGEIEVVGRTASFNREPNPFVLAGIEEWAKDFGFRLAEYPGGTDMNDRIKNKEWPTTYDKGDPEADPGKAFDGEPQGELSCPYCNETLPNFKEYVMHTQNHQNSDAAPIDDGHFPTIEDMDTPLPLRPHNVTPTAIPVMGSMNPWKFVASEDEGDGWAFEAAGGKEGKDLLQAPIPFIYDIEKDYITVGHPGMRTPDVMPVGGEEPVTIPPVGLPPEGQEGQQVELGGETYVWHNH